MWGSTSLLQFSRKHRHFKQLSLHKVKTGSSPIITELQSPFIVQWQLMKTAVLILFLNFTFGETWRHQSSSCLCYYFLCKQGNLRVKKTACTHKLNRNSIDYAMQFTKIASGISWGLLSVFWS